MSAAMDNGPLLGPSPLAEATQRNGDDNHHPYEAMSDHSNADQRTSPVNYTERSALHRVTNMLKEKLSRREDDLGEDAEITSSRELYHSNTDIANKMKYPQGSVTPASGNALSNSNGLSDSSVEDLAVPLSRHPVRLMGPDMMPENSKVLRGILQGREFKDRQQLAEKTTTDSLDAEMSNIDMDDNDSELMRNGNPEYDLEDSMQSQPNSPGELSCDDMSDQENNMNGANSTKMTDELELSQDEDEDSCQNLESNEAKRARVETIISSMRTSPLRNYCDNATVPSSDLRRPKRKQYRPQQHDVYMSESEVPAKVRRMEKDVLQKQLKHMQEQLVHMQHRYQQLFDHDSSQHSDLSDFSELHDKRGPNEEKASPKERSVSDLRNSEKTDIANSHYELGHFLKEASKLVKEQETSSTKQQTSPVINPEQPADLQNLAKMLKAEISNSVDSLVDSIVAKFVDKQKKKESTKELLKSSEAPKDQVNIVKPIVSGSSNSLMTTSSSSSNINSLVNNNNNNTLKLSSATEDADSGISTPKSVRAKVTDRIMQPQFDHQFSHKPFMDLVRAHPPLFAPPPYYPHIPALQPLFGKEPEQTEALPLVVNTPKKKRTKVTDTRLSPRAARALLQENIHHGGHLEMDKPPHHLHHPLLPEYHPPPLVPASLPTSVAIPNPSLQHSDILAMYSHERGAFGEYKPLGHSPNMPTDHNSPVMGHTPTEHSFQMFKAESGENAYDHSPQMENMTYDGHPMTTTLTPMHLRKAKLMFFYVRYPSSSILKVYFPDVKFNKNNTAQLVKWFSNFREFYYIQMEKYARQAISEGIKSPEDILVNLDSELYRVINLHYNRNNQIEVPDHFRMTVQSTLREFFKALYAGKDTESSWKKAIYKVIARMDDTLPEYFKSPNWMEALNESC